MALIKRSIFVQNTGQGRSFQTATPTQLHFFLHRPQKISIHWKARRVFVNLRKTERKHLQHDRPGYWRELDIHHRKVQSQCCLKMSLSSRAGDSDFSCRRTSIVTSRRTRWPMPNNQTFVSKTSAPILMMSYMRRQDLHRTWPTTSGRPTPAIVAARMTTSSSDFTVTKTTQDEVPSDSTNESRLPKPHRDQNLVPQLGPLTPPVGLMPTALPCRSGPGKVQ